MKSKTYEEFVEKFKPKKTTDDCYTPPYIYDAVKSWAVNEYGLEGRPVVRPFYPGGDYENYEYPENGVVIDNPPFSILSKILDFYLGRQIDFSLFAPTLTIFSNIQNRPVNCVIIDCAIEYENGAKVRTSYVTNMGAYKINVCSELNEIVNGIQREALKKDKKELPKYDYPDELLTAAKIQKIAKYCDLKIKGSDVEFVRALDAQRAHKKAIFGGGFLLSEKSTAEKLKAEKAAAEKAAAEKAAAEKANAEKVGAEVWGLSDRELEIIRELSGE